MLILKMEISAKFVEQGYRTGNMIKSAVIVKGLPIDAKLKGAELNRYGNLELRFESEGSEGEEKYIDIECKTMNDA